MDVEIAQEWTLPGTPAEVWEALWDVPRLARCIPGCGPVTTLSPGQRYAATVARRIGPFALAFEVTVSVTESAPPSRLGLTMAGVDRRTRTEARQSMTIGLTEASTGGTRVTVEGTTVLEGMLASLGRPLIRAHVEEAFDEFAQSLKASF